MRRVSSRNGILFIAVITAVVIGLIIARDVQSSKIQEVDTEMWQKVLERRQRNHDKERIDTKGATPYVPSLYVRS